MADRLPDTDLFAALEPPREDVERPVGLIEGPPRWEEGFGAGLRCWCGPHHGWIDLGEVALAGMVGCVTSHKGRLRVGITFDLGPGPSRPIRGRDDDAEDYQASGDDAERLRSLTTPAHVEDHAAKDASNAR
jgi:hypothetical protein